MVDGTNEVAEQQEDFDYESIVLRRADPDDFDEVYSSMLQVHYQCCNAEVVRSDPVLNPQNLHRRYACRERPGANYR